MSYLLIKPVGGIANRMRALESAYNYAASNALKMVVLWEQNEILNARYSDCFERLPGCSILELNYTGNSIFSKIKRKLIDLSVGIIKITCARVEFYDKDIEKLLFKCHFQLPAVKVPLYNIAAAGKGVYIESCWDFYPNSHAVNIEIKKDIQQAGREIFHSLSCNIGVHIRRTDHATAIQSSPLDLFIAEISKALERDPNYKFYLSTDSDQVAEQLKKQFNNHIITGISIRERNSKGGIIAALVDLYCLSSCQEIWGSQSSSFSERAAIMTNIPLKIISKAK